MCKVRSFKKLDKNRVRILLGIQKFFADLYPQAGNSGDSKPWARNAQQSELTVSQGFPS